MTRRHFIAGAECPYCQALDRMVVEYDLEGVARRRSCLACGRDEEMPEAQPLAESPAAEAEVRILRFDG